MLVNLREYQNGTLHLAYLHVEPFYRCLVCKEMIDQGSQEWRVIDNEFASIDGCIMSCCCAQSPKGIIHTAFLIIYI